ncbi:hypothetical protein F4810DRAFT_682613 [Camillea tinctor]|nr:hypothetical protein F4810DRAFT_682613 [Camillea tinctor]
MLLRRCATATLFDLSRHPTIITTLSNRSRTTNKSTPLLSPTSPPRFFSHQTPSPKMSPAATASSSSSSPSQEPPASTPPPLTPSEFRGYNRLAEHMDHFHAHFRRTWTLLYDAARTGRRPAGLSLKSYIAEGLSFISHLETHHSIEETYIFPVLARRMPEFQAHPAPRSHSKAKDNGGGKDAGEEQAGNGEGAKGKAQAAELLQQHKEIHAGMEGMQSYLRACRSGETELEMSVLREQMDTWGGVLWKHLDQEVATLGAENMRKYWTIEEIRRIPM